MRRLAVLLVLVACNVTPSPPVPPVAGTHAPVPDPWANPTPPPPSAPAPDTMKPQPYLEHPNPPAGEPVARTYGPAPQPPAPHAIVAPPSQAMRALAVTPDGTTAVTADVTGSVRLWPTLDGTREPVVVPMRRPVVLAATRGTDGRGVVIAGIDGAGQLELVVTTAFGATPVRTAIDLPRPATALYATSLGFLVELDDQHLTFITRTGQPLGEVEPPAGTDIASIAVHGDAMIALLDGGGTVHARWLNLAKSQLAWGDQTGALPILPRAIALAPDHKSIAAVEPGEKASRLVTVGLAHGDVHDEGPDSEFEDPSMTLVGFVDATTVLVRFGTFTSLWHTDGGNFTTLNEERRAPVTALAASKIVSGTGAELEIADAAGTVRFLGFRIGTLSMFAPGARTLLATDGQHLVRLASDLRDHATYELPEPQDTGYSVLALLDTDHVLVQTYRSETYVDVVSLDTMEMTPLPNDERFLGYDPPSRVAAFATNDKVRFRRFTAKGTFGDAADLDTKNVSSVIFTGDRAILTSYRDDGTYAEQTVARIRPEAHTLKVVRTVTHPLQETDDGGTFAPPATIEFKRTAKSADGALIATLTAGRLSLRDADGTLRWTAAAPGTSDVVWLRSGELFATGAGLARVDLETGAYAERRCGWQFGLWAERVDVFASAQICEAE